MEFTLSLEFNFSSQPPLQKQGQDDKMISDYI